MKHIYLFIGAAIITYLLIIAGNIGFDVVCAQHSLDMDSGNTTLSILIFLRIHVLS